MPRNRIRKNMFLYIYNGIISRRTFVSNDVQFNGNNFFSRAVVSLWPSPLVPNWFAVCNLCTSAGWLIPLKCRIVYAISVARRLHFVSFFWNMCFDFISLQETRLTLTISSQPYILGGHFMNDFVRFSFIVGTFSKGSLIKLQKYSSRANGILDEIRCTESLVILGIFVWFFFSHLKILIVIKSSHSRPTIFTYFASTAFVVNCSFFHYIVWPFVLGSIIACLRKLCSVKFMCKYPFNF